MAFTSRNVIEDTTTFLVDVPAIIAAIAPVVSWKQLYYISKNIQEYDFSFGTATVAASGGETSHTWVG